MSSGGRRTNGLLAIASLCSVVVSCAPTFEPRTITLSRVLSLPAVLAPDPSGLAEARGAGAALTIVLGALDELPRGPTGFDVLPDGSLVLADALSERLVYFGPDGDFRSERAVGFQVSSIRERPGGVIEMRSMRDSGFYLLQEGGSARRISEEERARQDSVLLLGPQRAMLRTEGAEDLEVRFERPGERLLSVSPLGKDSAENTYVVLETTRGGSTVEVSKVIRKYSRSGRLAAQIEDIVLDYVVHPVDEFRMREGIVYQMVPKEREVLIRMWDTN